MFFLDLPLGAPCGYSWDNNCLNGHFSYIHLSFTVTTIAKNVILGLKFR